MRHVCGVTCWAVLALAFCASAAPAADKDAHKSELGPGRYKVVDGHHNDYILDMSKEADKKKIFAMLEAGDVREMEAVIDPNPLGIQYDLALWTVVIFVALLFLLRKLAWGPMVEGLNKRESSILQAVEEAKLARDETERIRAQFKADADRNAAKIAEMLAEARRDADKLVADKLAKAEADIQAERQRVRRDFEIARDQALQDLTTHAANLATLISAKAIGRSLSADDHYRLVDEAVQEIRTAAVK